MNRSPIMRARNVLETAASAIQSMAKGLDDNFLKVVEHLYSCTYDNRGRVVVTGMGKSGIIGRKLSATLASTGTPSLFMHPSEAVHGDLGMLQTEDVILILCFSGETEEIKTLLPPLKLRQVKICSIVGRVDSTVARRSDACIVLPPIKEGCPLGRAPMASTTTMLSVGDALAAVLMDKRGFDESQYAEFHPKGSLGRALLTTVEDLMIPLDRVPMVAPTDDMRTVVQKMNERNVGACLIVAEEKLEGIFTDGDIKRFILQNFVDPSLDARVGYGTRVAEVMTEEPKTACSDELAEAALKRMEENPESQITVLPVVNGKGVPVGLIRLHDIIQAKIR